MAEVGNGLVPKDDPRINWEEYLEHTHCEQGRNRFLRLAHSVLSLSLESNNVM